MSCSEPPKFQEFLASLVPSSTPESRRVAAAIAAVARDEI